MGEFERLPVPNPYELVELNLSAEATISQFLKEVEGLLSRVEELKDKPEEVERFEESLRIEMERVLNNYANNISIFLGKFLALTDSLPGLFDDDKLAEGVIASLRESFRRIELMMGELRGLANSLRDGELSLEEFKGALEAWVSRLSDDISLLETIESQFLEVIKELEEGATSFEEVIQFTEGEEDELEEEVEQEEEDELDEEPTEEELEALMKMDESELEALIEGQIRGLHEDLEELKRYIDSADEDRDTLRSLPPEDEVEEYEEELESEEE